MANPTEGGGAEGAYDGPALPPGWSSCVSRSTGHRYFLEVATGKTQWQYPAEAAATAAAASAVRRQGQTQMLTQRRVRARSKGSTGAMMAAPEAAKLPRRADASPADGGFFALLTDELLVSVASFILDDADARTGVVDLGRLSCVCRRLAARSIPEPQLQQQETEHAPAQAVPKNVAARAESALARPGVNVAGAVAKLAIDTAWWADGVSRQRAEGEPWLRVLWRLRHLQWRRYSPREYAVDGAGTRLRSKGHSTSTRYRVALAGMPMTAGGGATAVHYAEFGGLELRAPAWLTLLPSSYRAAIGVGRPGLDVEKTDGGTSPQFWGWSTLHGRVFGAHERMSWADWSGYTQGDTLGLLLDCAAGTLTAYKNGARLGMVVQSGLEGQLCWAASVGGGSSLEITAKPPPAGWRTDTTTNTAPDEWTDSEEESSEDEDGDPVPLGVLPGHPTLLLG
jgi:hypothetical protein